MKNPCVLYDDAWDLSGIWQCELPGQSGALRLPGTLDESGLGFPDDPERQWKAEEVRRIGFYRDGDPIVTRLTRKRAFEGRAKISRVINVHPPEGKRLFLEVERARHLRLLVNGEEILPYVPGSVSTPWVFEVTGKIFGDDQIVFLSDNSYPGWPRDAIVYASAASDETQTNWNGLLGYVRLRAEERNFIAGVRAYPEGDSLDVCVALDFSRDWEGNVFLSSQALLGDGKATAREKVQAGRRELWYTGLALEPKVKKWDVEEGNLYSLTVSLDGLKSRTVSFGVRDFRALDGFLSLNGRRFFLRGEANCAVFPETGYPPMEKSAWKSILQKYRDYGVNCMRFHSHCPPEAAFAAADEMGMLMQPELSHWDPEHAFASPEAQACYRTEFLQILKVLANHPSFVMLTLGNELHADDQGRRFMNELLQEARGKDPTRLYANGSNPFYGALGPDAGSDFFTASDAMGIPLRAASAGFQGWLNRPDAPCRADYRDGMEAVRAVSRQPVFSFEAGQYEVLPDFGEIAAFRGVTSPENLKHIQRKVRQAGLEDTWARRVAATGELSLLCYRAEVEAALATPGLSGISLLGLQDFPGQGTALVGMMNAHLEQKPHDFAKPQRFRAFFRDVLPLALLNRRTFTAGEILSVPVKLANWGKTDLTGALSWRLAGKAFSLRGEEKTRTVPQGTCEDLSTLRLPLDGFREPEKLTLTLSFGEYENSCALWVYPDETPVCPKDVYECRFLDEKARSVLAAGGKVYLAPDSTQEALPHSIKAQFSTDFWSVCTFPFQAGAMGQCIDEKHPLFDRFPTDFHTDWQWRPMACSRAVILPGRFRAIIEEMDSYAFLRPMAQLLEGRCGGGRLMFSSLGLHALAQHPEARALQCAIYHYMASDQFQPAQELPLTWAMEAAKP